jgi:precorrin-6Y C5,15-methyltransferase (decarboxylating)
LLAWQAGFDTMLNQLQAHRGTPTVILASGDPMWFGIGATLAKHLGPGEFTVYPVPSAFQLAAARLRWPLQHVATLSLHGRPVELLHPHLQPGNRILALTSDAAQLAAIKGILNARGYGQSVLTLLENLGGPEERIGPPPARSDLYVLAIDCVADALAPLLPTLAGLPDEAFVSDGQLTKREVRAITLAKLAPTPGAILWDVGAGCGSIGIEWMRGARDAQAIAIEREPQRRNMIAANARALGTPGLRIVPGEAPQALAGLPAPDAIFIGGGLTQALADVCWDALHPGGRLVTNTVTVEAELALLALYHRRGGEVCRIEVATLASIGGLHGFRPKMPVTQYRTRKP